MGRRMALKPRSWILYRTMPKSWLSEVGPCHNPSTCASEWHTLHSVPLGLLVTIPIYFAWRYTGESDLLMSATPEMCVNLR
jgi:hypothetical protein